MEKTHSPAPVEGAGFHTLTANGRAPPPNPFLTPFVIN